ncbi:MAG: cysteine synthase A [Lachnospiraceae bacterium]
MGKLYKSVEEMVGNTPLMQLCKYEKDQGLQGHLFAKLEYFNPAGSIKDRVALAMIKEAEQKGQLKRGTVIIEPTSGNTGIGLAAIAASRGYHAIFTMPDTMSMERRKLLAGYGAELVLTPGSEGMTGAIKKAEALASEYEDAFIPGQFTNPANPKAHRETTGPEIWEDTNGEVDILVAGIGTGGTITGLSEYLLEKNPRLKIIGVEPLSSPVLSQGISGIHKIQGIGADFVPEILKRELIHEVIPVSDEDAIQMVPRLASLEGIFVGISSGAALTAAHMVAKRKENAGKTIIVIFPDGGDRYLG